LVSDVFEGLFVCSSILRRPSVCKRTNGDKARWRNRGLPR
jgi:hypothetical protein